MRLRDPLTEADTPELGRILAGAADPGALGSDALALACVVQSARRRGWPVLTANAAALRALDPELGTDELPQPPRPAQARRAARQHLRRSPPGG